VNAVGVDLNTASQPLLARVSGVTAGRPRTQRPRRRAHWPTPCAAPAWPASIAHQAGASAYPETVTFTPASRSQSPVVAVACTTALALGA
jgi:hypothetical protein